MMLEHYDFLAFENYYQAKNHKIDVLLIAHLLHHSGLKVAILDIFHEDTFDEIEGIPIVHHHVKIPAILFANRAGNVLWRVFQRLLYYRCQYKFMSQVRDEVRSLADYFYCGSYHLGMSSAWFELNKPCYWWGLRSNRFVLSWYHFKSDKYTFYRIPYLRYKFLSNKKQYLFVSNEIIKKEFNDLGVPDYRMVIREERVIDHLGDADYDKQSDTFTFLTIGQLRPQKRVEHSIKAFLAMRRTDVYFNVVGRSSESYEKIISDAMDGSKLVHRENSFLDYNVFLNFFKKCHFVVFADQDIQGTVTNGTMLEALINYRPIIAPNYHPYRYYIENYHVGILYNPNIKGDLTRAMQKAIEVGSSSFKCAINVFLQSIIFDKVASSLRDQIFNTKKN